MVFCRFDILCVVKDIVDPVLDERLAEFVVSSHIRAHPDNKDKKAESQALDPDILPQDMLRKYVTYAKQNCKPGLQLADYDKIASVMTSDFTKTNLLALKKSFTLEKVLLTSQCRKNSGNLGHLNHMAD